MQRAHGARDFCQGGMLLREKSRNVTCMSPPTGPAGAFGAPRPHFPTFPSRLFKMKNRFLNTTLSVSVAVSILFGAVSAPVALGCATCGSSLNADWESQGYSTEQGFK